MTDTADDMEALHAAMRNAANTPTLGLDDSSYGVTTHQDTKPEPSEYHRVVIRELRLKLSPHLPEKFL